MARFWRRGTSKTYFLPAVAGDSPTRAEITAGKDLSPQVNNLVGWQFSNERLPAAEWGSEYVEQVDGPNVLDDSGIGFIDDDASTVVRLALARSTVGFVLLLPYGDVPTKRCEVWPVKSAGPSDEWTTSAEPARFRVDFAITGPPRREAVIPA